MVTYCLDCKKEKKSSYSKRCYSCSSKLRQKHLWNNVEYRQHMKDVHKGYMPTNVEKLKEHGKSKENLKMLEERNKWMKGSKHPMFGRDNPKAKGANSNFWKGGISLISRIIRQNVMGTGRYRRWRIRVFERDSYTCQSCKAKGVYLNADHIKPFALFPKLIFDINNGKTLCRGCHKIKTKDDWLKWKDFKREVLI